MDELHVLLKALEEHPDVVAVDILTRWDVRESLRVLELPDDDATLQRVLDSDEWGYGNGGDCSGFDLSEVRQEVSHVASVLGLA